MKGGRVKGLWVGPSHCIRRVPVVQGHWGKPKQKKIDAQKENHCQNFVIESLQIYLEHLALHITTKPNKPLVQPVEASLTLQWKLNLCFYEMPKYLNKKREAVSINKYAKLITQVHPVP